MVQQVISFHYELKNEKEEIMDSSREAEPLTFLEGVGQIIPGLEKELLKMAVGQSQVVYVPYEEGYGAYDQSLVVKVPRKNFPAKDIKEGDVFQVERREGPQLVTVVELSNDTVTVDANHPMAGKNLFFSVELMAKREATPEEVSHGHAHDGHGHHH